jgi:FAD:protein FMN transferase
MTVTELRLHVMASAAHVILVDPAPGAEAYARGRLQQLERRWSRFIPRSELSRLNAAPEAFLAVSPDTIALLTAMKAAGRATAGRYDPCMLHDIVAAGYDTSIDGSGHTSRAAGALAPRGSIADVAVDAQASLASVPAGVGLDAGGIGKGLAADLVVTELLERGSAGALVSVGGDLAAAGTPPTTAGWRVRAEHAPGAAPEVVTLTMDSGGVATSSTRTRTWVSGGRRRHHVLDPATRAASGTDLAAVTVIARAGWEAEAQATAALLCGAARVLDYLENHGLDGIATTCEDAVLMTAGLREAAVAEGSAV